MLVEDMLISCCIMNNVINRKLLSKIYDLNFGKYRTQKFYLSTLRKFNYSCKFSSG